MDILCSVQHAIWALSRTGFETGIKYRPTLLRKFTSSEKGFSEILTDLTELIATQIRYNEPAQLPLTNLTLDCLRLT